MTGPIYRIPAAGGTREMVTKVPPGSLESHHFPLFLPDGKHFLYFVDWSAAQPNGLYVASLDADAPKLISPDITGNVLFASGNLLYVRDRAIMAQPFDTSALKTTGAALPITQQEVDKFQDWWNSGFSVSQDGKLLFQSAGDAQTRLVWYGPSGKELGQFPEIGYEAPQFSPDGRSLAVYTDEHDGRHFIRVYDLDREISVRLTEGGNETLPVWSRDGKSIAYRDASIDIAEIPADGSGPPRLVVKGTDVLPCDWSADGHFAYMSLVEGPAPALYVYSPLEQNSTRVANPGSVAQFSPDGKWIAYGTRGQIVVQPFPALGTRIQISNVTGSTQPRWSRDGSKIFFVQPDRKLMVVDFDPAKRSASPPQLFAQTRMPFTVGAWFQYDVASDGRLLVNSMPADNSSPLTLLTNWTAELKK